MKKTLLTLGTIATVTAPVVAVVSCGKKTTNEDKKETTTNRTTTVLVSHTQSKDAVDQSIVSKRFLELLLGDENNVVEPIHHDSTQEFINKIIPLWTQAEKESGVTNLTFAEGFVFDQTDSNAINTVSEKVTTVIKGLISGLAGGTGSGMSGMLMSELPKLITADLVKSFIEEKYISSGLMNLLQELLKGVFKIEIVSTMGEEGQANLLWMLLKGLIPFKDDADHTNVSATYENNNLVFQYKDKKTFASFITNITSIGSSLASNAPAASGSGASGDASTPQPKTKLSFSSLMNILTDQATTNLVSGLLTYMARDVQLSALIKSLLRTIDSNLLHVENTSSFSDGSVLFSIEANGAPIENLGRPTAGLIDWYRTTIDSKAVLVDKTGQILAELVKLPNSGYGYNIKFLVDKLPLKTTLNGANIQYRGAGIIKGSRADFNNHEISLRELISEYEVRDIIKLIGIAYAMILQKMQSFGIKDTWGSRAAIRNDIMLRMFVPNYKGINIEDSAIRQAHVIGATDIENHLKGIKANLEVIHQAFPADGSMVNTLKSLMSEEDRTKVESITSKGFNHATSDEVREYKMAFLGAIEAYLKQSSHTDLDNAVQSMVTHILAVQVPTGLDDIIKLLTGDK